MKRYFKRVDADSIYGTGTFYVEYDGEVATRQVEVYGTDLLPVNWSS